VKVEGSYTFEAPRDVVWKALLDPEILANVLPGCEKLEQVGENDYEGALKVKVGPVQGKFQGKVTLADLNEPESYTMQVEGRGPAGFMKGKGNIQLEDQGEATLMHYEGTAQVGGRIASVGQRLIDSTSKALTRQSLESLHTQIKAGQQPAQNESETAPADTATQSASEDEEAQGEADAEAEQATASASFSNAAPPSQTQFAIDVARDVIDDLIPAEKRPMIVAALGILGLFLFVDWWAKRVAHHVARILKKRR